MVRLVVALLMIGSCLGSAVWLGRQQAESAVFHTLPPDGSYTVQMNVYSGAGHQPFILMPAQIKLDFSHGYYESVNQEQTGGFFRADVGGGPFVKTDDFVGDQGIRATYFRKNAEGSWEFYMEGSGTVAGHEHVRVTFEGHFEENGAVTGFYTMGADYELPGGYPIVYQAKNGAPGVPEPTDTPEPTEPECKQGAAGGSCAETPTATPGPQETVAQFLQLFNTALQTGDESFLLARLDPHVIETYGEANCAATVAAIVDPTSSFTIKSSSGPAPWKWSPPGVSVLIDDVYTVSVKRVVEGESSMQDIHLAVVEGHLTWFRTCGPAGTPVATTTPDNCVIAGGSNCTPTNTPTPPVVPSTETPSATPRRPGNGDCDNNGTSNALDALHILQYTAGLLPAPGACGDTNGDGIVNTIDVSLILQYTAGLLQQLPWNQ